ncbi:MAG: adenosyl-hopene transferase HpnH [Alphaproteobacteria bacterium]|nr:adenosyl-hopene transferase HpnH [Alphaproteobacteria bacterium]
MAVPLIQQIRVGAYVVRQRLRGVSRYPLVLMLEPLFQCNLSCTGCGKIAYPEEILKRRLSVQECLDAVDECGAPVVSIPGGEPLLHKEIDQIVAGIVARKKFVYLCTNALLLERNLDRFTPTPYLTLSVHLDGDRDHHDRSVAQEGVYDRAVKAIRAAAARGFRLNINCTLFEGGDVPATADFFTFACKDLGVEGITVSPGFAYEKAPAQDQFLSRSRTRDLFRDLFRRGRGQGWVFSQSTLFLDFLAGNQAYQCTPWGNPTRNVFGWQRPCYLLNHGHAASFRELMEETDWDSYGVGRNPACDNCMMHCGFEPTAVTDTVAHPLKALGVVVRGIRTEGPVAPEIPRTVG